MLFPLRESESLDDEMSEMAYVYRFRRDAVRFHFET